MKTLKKFDFPAGPTSTGETHDWDKILNGGIYKLTPGEDFKCKEQTFRMMAYKHAKKRGGSAKVAKDKSDNTLVIQFVQGENGGGEGTESSAE